MKQISASCSLYIRVGGYDIIHKFRNYILHKKFKKIIKHKEFIAPSIRLHLYVHQYPSHLLQSQLSIHGRSAARRGAISYYFCLQLNVIISFWSCQWLRCLKKLNDQYSSQLFFFLHF